MNLNAKMADFAGWQMPIQYKNLKKEVISVRESVGVFDVSHMGEFFIQGPQALEFVDYIVTNDIKNAQIKKAIYSPLCREDGTVIDDLIVYKLSDENIMICVNASNIKKDFEWMKKYSHKFNCELTDRSDDFSLLAIQGPQTLCALKKIDLGFKLEDIDYYSIQVAQEQDSKTPIFMARTGYTGEDGFEIFASHSFIQNLWKDLISHGVTPCGLGARDVLRLEAGYPLYGNELNDEITPLDAALKWTVKMNKGDFIGKSTLKNLTPTFRSIKIMLDKGIPRAGYSVENQAGKEIGVITSGTMSVVLKKGIAIARVRKDLYGPDEQIIVNIRGKKYATTICKKPFVIGGHK